MSAALSLTCFFCGAAAGEPCRSVGHLPIVEPHMQRLRLAIGHAIDDDAEILAARDAYAVAVVTLLFGCCTDELLARCRKDRSIDERKPWVKRQRWSSPGLAL